MPAETIDEVLAALDAVIERAIEDGDRRGYFAVLYRKVTAKVKDGLGTDFFDDPARMERLDVLFANRYLEAEGAFTSGSSLTRSWQLAFDACSRWRPLLLQHLLVGINAHINLDLGIAAARTAPGEELEGLREDYLRINQALASMIASVQGNLASVSPWLGLIDKLGGRADDELIRFSIVLARAGAWRFATELGRLPAESWDDRIAQQDARVARVAHSVLHPGLLSTGLLLIRLRESGDVGQNIAALAAAPEPSLEAIEAAVEEASLPES